MNHYGAVLFISFGGPEKSEDIMPFLEIVTRGRGIPRERLEEVAHHYERLGGSSPINEITRTQARALEKALAVAGVSLPVYIGQRNWHPFLEDTLRRMEKDGVKRAVGFPTAAHRSEASLERYVNAVETARQTIGPTAPQIDYVHPWFDHPLFIGAIRERVKEALASAPGLAAASAQDEAVPWIFTAHSIPCAMAKESTYVQELRRTAGSVAQSFGRNAWSLAYSSRSGNPREPWLTPDVCDAIRTEAESGAKDILFIPIGFIADHIEILFDLDVEAKEAAEAAGVRLHRSKSVGDHPLFVGMMADVIQQRIKGSEIPQQRSSASTIYADNRCEENVGTSSKTCFCFPGDPDPPCCRWVSSASRSRPTPPPPRT